MRLWARCGNQPMVSLQAPTLSAPYLESALLLGIAAAEDYQNELALIYLRLALGAQHHNTSGEANKLCWYSSFIVGKQMILLLGHGKPV